MAKEQLNGAQIGARFEQVNREGMAQRVRAMGLAMPARRRAVRQACSTACVVIGWPKYPGKSHSFGRTIRQYSRSVSSSFGESMT